MDVETAFLIPDLPEEEQLYMRPPAGFADLCQKLNIPFRNGQSLKLKKCIYGLKQSGRYWNKKFVRALQKFGLQQSPYDCCLFVGGKTINDLIIVIFYVDDVLVCAREPKRVQVVQQLLSSVFPMKKLGPPRLWTGIEVTPLPEGGYFLSQTEYIKRAARRLNLSGCSSSRLPCSSLLKRDDSSPPASPAVQNGLYRATIGTLLWISLHTRPDICFAVTQAARFCENPSALHWSAVKQIVGYLLSTCGLGLPHAWRVQHALCQ